MEKLSADALRLALVTASMEYYKKYVEGNQDFDNSEQIKEELGKAARSPARRIIHI